MPTSMKNVDHYRIYYWASGTESPIIDCYEGNAYIGKLIFHDTAGDLPPNVMLNNGIIYLRYRLSQFNDIITILRQEKPLFIGLSTPGLLGFLATNQGEPVGEEET